MTRGSFKAKLLELLAARVDTARRWVPRRVRYALQRFISLRQLKLRWRELENPLAQVDRGDENRVGTPMRLGIVHNAAQYHVHFVRACRELGVPFRVLNLYHADWLDRVDESGCDALLVWPDAVLSVWNSMIKDRIEVIEHHLGIPAVPSSREIWMYEDKRRMAYWLKAHNVPHPRTWVFYELKECEEFVDSCQLPIVYKASFGASSSGVRIFRDRGRLLRFARRVFKAGYVPRGFDRWDRQWGSVLLQEYLPGVREWRMVRIGDSFFGHGKGQVGEFHSGSGAVDWTVPETRHLDFLEEVTDKGGFRSMDVDVFERRDGTLLVNELQAVFGASYAVHQLRVDGVPGRFTRREGQWAFEPGDFARNACANERVRDVLARDLHRTQAPARYREHNARAPQGGNR